MTDDVPPTTEKIRPVTSLEAALPSHTTIGEMFSGAAASRGGRRNG